VVNSWVHGVSHKGNKKRRVWREGLQVPNPCTLSSLGGGIVEEFFVGGGKEGEGPLELNNLGLIRKKKVDN